MTIHPTAIIDPKAEIDSEAEIGPYVVIEGAVKVMGGTRVMAHAYLTGWTEIGADNEIHPGAVLGGAPQDRAYNLTARRLHIALQAIRPCWHSPIDCSVRTRNGLGSGESHRWGLSC